MNNGQPTTRRGNPMIITTRQFLSSVWLLIALIVATILAVALPSSVRAQTVATVEFNAEGYASYYNLNLHGAKTASGERYDHKALTAAHASLPFDSMVKVTNKENNSFVIVRINDRMRPDAKRIIDLSGAAAQKIGLFDAGIVEVTLSLVDAQQMTLKSKVGPPEPKVKKPIGNGELSGNAKSPIASSVGSASKIQPASIATNAAKKPTYTLQIGSFSTSYAAEKLAKIYPEAWIERVQTEDEVTFRVYFSRFEDEKPARMVQNALWTKGQDSFLRKVAP